MPKVQVLLERIQTLTPSGEIPDCGEQAGFELVSYLVELQHALESSMSSFTGGAIPALFRVSFFLFFQFNFFLCCVFCLFLSHHLISHHFQDSANQLSADFSLEDDGLEVVERAPQNNVVSLT